MFKLDHFGFLRVSGIDAIKFLQGYTTCDLDALDNDTVQMGAICNLKGRMLTSFLIVRDDSDLTLRMHRKLIHKTIEFLTKYIVFSKATLTDISEELYCFGRIDVSAGNSVTRITSQGNDSDQDSVESSGHGPAYEIGLNNRIESWLPSQADASVDSRLEWNEAEISAGVAWVDDITTEEYLPQMFNYQALGAIDFEKGCYLGQEIIARLHYRGELKKRLYRADVSLNENCDDWVVVSTGSESTLLLMRNEGEAPVTLKTLQGEHFIAEPL